jgi:alkanesulfonate monooxygenase SsuD/methylene tetrahydromethanopterin reductase-like flavin-dependent oxidoreductase (luciferase family)/hemerythrin-like domain-containing protein
VPAADKNDHELLFGSFITPSAASPEVAVALAQLSERVGLDLVTFQDHPYLPQFVDTWTLLSYVAARTEVIRLAPNVINLPLRQPVVLARSAASLDLLSGGRLELGVGAGAFWDAIEASGGRRLSAGQAVEALEEAITIVREVWAADVPGGVRVHGSHYQVVGAKRGPAPAHDIGVWVGAYKPRMLALVGRVGDGWLPSLSYLTGPEQLAQLNALIDEAAVGAGRDPRRIRRLLNVSGAFANASTGFLHGPPDQWAEELAGLVLDYGVSAFILGSDDPHMLQVFAQEVAPAVREAVVAETPPPTDAEAERSEDAQLAGDTVFDLAPPIVSASRPVTVWDESQRPHGPEPEPGQTYTARGRAVGAHLVEVHDHLRRELDQVRDLVRQVRAGILEVGDARSELNQMALRQNSWTLGGFCESYCRIVTGHHSLEDAAVFPHLRSADPRLAPVIDRLAEEHRAIHHVLDGVDASLVHLVAQPDDIDRVADAVELLADTLLSHLAYEEHELVEPLSRLGFYDNQV